MYNICRMYSSHFRPRIDESGKTIKAVVEVGIEASLVVEPRLYP
jgi:hypothetical protein